MIPVTLQGKPSAHHNYTAVTLSQWQHGVRCNAVLFNIIASRPSEIVCGRISLILGSYIAIFLSFMIVTMTD